MAKATKNMDSVFADCTDKELDFELLFDDYDDTLVDIVAGCNEAGELITGEYLTMEEVEALSIPEDEEYQKDGDASVKPDNAEGTGTKSEDLEIGAEVGDGKEVSGDQNSAEAHADDVTKDMKDAIGDGDAQQTKLEGADPLTDDDQAERAGEEVSKELPPEITGKQPETEVGATCTKAEDEGCCKEAYELLEAANTLLEFDMKTLKDANAKDMVSKFGAKLKNVAIDAAKAANKAGESVNGAVSAAVDKAIANVPEESKGQVKGGILASLRGAAIAAGVAAGVAIGKKAATKKQAEEQKNVKESAIDIDNLADSILESILGRIELEEEADPTEDKCDCGRREGSIKDNSGEVEGKDYTPIGADYTGSVKKDVIADPDDAESRAGKVDTDTQNVEGKSSKVVEGAEVDNTNIADAVKDAEDELVDINITDDVVPDSVQTSKDSNEIDLDIKNTNESDDSFLKEMNELLDEATDDPKDLMDDSEDDIDIEAIEKGDFEDDEEIDLKFDNSDDDLIDLVISGEAE